MGKTFSLSDLHKISENQNQLDWKYFKEGIEILPLTYHEDNKPASALLRYQPGAKVSKHIHPGFEYIFILEGSQQDDNGRYEKGSLLISSKGSQHSVFSENGCIVLAIWEKTVEFVE